MFTKNSVSQSMIDAVESVLAEDKKLLLEPEAEKKDRKKKDEVEEELKGNQVKLDKNHNGKLDKQDFKLLRMKKESVLDAIKSGNRNKDLTEMDKSQTPPGRDGGHREGPEKIARPISREKALKDMGDALNKSMKDAYKKAKNEEVESVEERTLSPHETAEKERIVKSMKKGLAGFKARYGDRAKSVMYATATKQAKNEEVEAVEEDIGAMQSVVGENKGKKAVRVDTLQGVTTSNDPEVKNANAHFSGKKATLKAEGKGTDTAVPFVTDSVSPTHREINKAVKPTFKKIKEMLGKTGTSE